MTNSNSKTEKRVPKATLESRTIKRCGKEVASYYCEFFCHRTVKLDDTHILKVELDEPNKHEKKSEISVLRNYEDVEEYLLGLDTSLDVDEVYGNMMKFLNFSDEDIYSCDKILISYIETIGKKERERGKILEIRGKTQEYAVLEDGETFHVFKNGNWIYLSYSGVEIVYRKDTQRYEFSVAGDRNSIIDTYPGEIMDQVSMKISNLWRFVK